MQVCSLHRARREAAIAIFAAAWLAATSPAMASVLPMLESRAGHTMTLLNDGTVLVAGNRGGEGRHTAEIYDPDARAWRRVPGMGAQRGDHSATLLPDGRVLVAGGTFGAGQVQADAEFYDPRTRRFTPAPGLVVARRRHAAVTLANGDVIVAGGEDASGLVAQAERYAAAAGRFVAVASLDVPRVDHATVRLADDSILVTGGITHSWSPSSPATAHTESYDPVRDAWTAASPMGTARSAHTATPLADGRVLVVGGIAGSTALASAEIYDPASRTWTPTGPLATPRRGHTATLLPDGRVLVAGGIAPALVQGLRSIEVFDPATGRWSRAADLVDGRVGHTALLMPDRRVLLAGGTDASASPAAETVEPLSMLWSAVTLAGPTVYDHALTALPDGRVLVTGGRDPGGSALVQARIFDPRNETFTDVAPMPRARAGHQALLMPDGRVMVVGGSYIPEAFFYDTTADTWTFAGTLTWPRNGQTAVLLGNGKVMVDGGGYNTRTEQYEPAANAWYPLGYGVGQDDGATATLLPDGRVLVAGGRYGNSPSNATWFYHPVTYSWTSGPALTWHRHNHRATALADGRVLVVGGYGAGGVPLTVSEIFDPLTDTWTRVGDTARALVGHALVTLPEGDVLAISGNGIERYDAAAQGWWTVGNLVNQRPRAEATVLPDGSVLVVGGYVTAPRPVERLQRTAAAVLPQPTLDSVPATLVQGASLVLTGDGFRGLFGGDGTGRAAPAGGPVVRMQRLEHGAQVTVLPGTVPWSAGTFQSAPLPPLAHGWYRVTVAADGMQSVAKYVAVATDPPPASTVQFDAAVYDLSETSWQANVLVQRSGDCTLAAGVNIMGWNQSVSPPALWYTAPVGWGPGDCMPKRVPIGVPDDTIANGPRTIELSFVNPANVTLGARATATLRVHDDEALPTSMPASAVIKANPYGPLKVTGAKLTGDTLTQLQRQVTIELGATPGTGSDALEIEFSNFRIGRGNTLVFIPGAAGQQVALSNGGSGATSIDGLVAAWDQFAFAAPLLAVHDPKGITVPSTGRIYGMQGLLMDALGGTPTVGQPVRVEGTVDGGPELTVMGSGIHGGGFYLGASIVLSTFGSANNPVNGNRFLANGLNLAPSNGTSLTLRLNHYGPKPQTFNVLAHGDATLMIPPAWTGPYASLPPNNPVTVQNGQVDAPWGGGQLLAQATGTLRLDDASGSLLFPGGMVFRAGRFIDLQGMTIDNGWTASGKSFQGMFFEAPRIGDSIVWPPPFRSASELRTNRQNWVNFSVVPSPAISVWQIFGPHTMGDASATAVHLNPYASMIETAAAGGCWVCNVDTVPVRLD